MMPPAAGEAPGAGESPGAGAAVLAPAVPVAPLGAAEKPSPERVQALYRQALVHWAAGQSEQAYGELAAVETRVVRDSDLRTAKALLRAEEKVIDDVAAADLEVLVPIARLHFEAYRRYLGLGLGHALVQRHSRIMVQDLALLYRKQSGSEGAALVASHLLTSLGEQLHRGAQHQAAAELYTQAAEIDPRNPVPALSLAIIYEKFEQYRSAAAWLRRVLAIDPKHAEARLRLAVNLGREGDTAEARQLLDGLIAENGDSWVTPLAFQELARLDERLDALAKAAQVLRAGLLRFPQSVRLHVQLAALLDRQGKAREAREVIAAVAELDVDAEEAHDDARFRYNATNTDAVAVSRTFFEENASSRMPLLATVLAAALARTSTPPAQASKQPGGAQR
jgi:tetratricopeptide (TPR) repeat protein